MSNYFPSVVSPSINKWLTIYLIPGFVPTLPLILAIQKKYPSASVYFDTREELLVLTIVIMCLVFGYVLEDLGGIIENKFCDPIAIKKLKKRHNVTRDEAKKEFNEIWDKYLKLTFNENNLPIGQRYLRSVLVRLKFELSMGLALVLGVAIASYYRLFLSIDFNRFHTIILLATASYLILYEAPRSSIALSDTRKILVEKYGS